VNPNTIGKPIEILLVEDNPGDVRLTLATFQAGGVRNKVHVAVDGEDALVFLRRQGKHAGAPRPDIVLLDLNLPKKSGREVLAEIKADPQLLDIPVVVLTVSQEESDILQTYDLRAHSYLTKPLLLDQVMKMIQSIEEFELVIVKRPTA
jgi:CheY-like chemotaxis protein